MSTEYNDAPPQFVRSPPKERGLEWMHIRRLKEDGHSVSYNPAIEYCLLYDHELTELKISQEEEL